MADSCWARMKGLIGRSADQFTEEQGLWIKPCEGIHTIGMSFPIDVAYLDGAGRIIHIYSGLPPFRLGVLKFKARSVLELTTGTLINSGTVLGDILDIISHSEITAAEIGCPG